MYNTTMTTIEEWIEQNFRDWKNRGSYLSFKEVREHLGFQIKETYHSFEILANDVGMEKYFTYCEMIFTLLCQLHCYPADKGKGTFHYFCDTAKAVIEKAGHMFYTQSDGEVIIVPKDAAVLDIVDDVPDELADVIIEYNHYKLRGNLQRKKEILKAIVDAIEPKRKTVLNSYAKQESDDFFYLVNNFDVRHNNSDPADPGKYNKVSAEMTAEDKETVYDLLYEQALALFMAVKKQDRLNRIQVLKDMMKQKA